MYKITSILFLISFAFISCNNEVSTRDKSAINIEQDHTLINKNENNTQTLITKKGDSIYLEISTPVGMSLNNITIKTPNFENTKPISLIDTDPVNKIKLYDLDNDGFEELFIFTTAAGSGSYGTIYAYSTNKGLYLSEIKTDILDQKIRGYTGHDNFSFEGEKLIRAYPLNYRKNDKSISIIKYQLNNGRLTII